MSLVPPFKRWTLLQEAVRDLLLPELIQVVCGYVGRSPIEGQTVEQVTLDVMPVFMTCDAHWLACGDHHGMRISSLTNLQQPHYQDEDYSSGITMDHGLLYKAVPLALLTLNVSDMKQRSRVAFTWGCYQEVQLSCNSVYLYAYLSGMHKISVIHRSTLTMAGELPLPPQTPGLLQGLQFHAEESVLFLAYGNRVYVLDHQTGAILRSWTRAGSSPCGICVMEDLVYVADGKNKRVQVFTTDGQLVHEWTEKEDIFTICTSSATQRLYMGVRRQILVKE